MTPEIIRVRPSGDGLWAVVTTIGSDRAYQKTPCPRCPWRLDAPIGAFPAQAYRDSAHTAYDVAESLFGCHATARTNPATCAGFLLRGAFDNLSVRIAITLGRLDMDAVHSPVGLYANYRAMAIANGVSPDDPVLAPCRGEDSLERTR